MNQLILIKYDPAAEWSRCRWQPIMGSPLLFVKFENNKLNLADSEKKTLILKESPEIDDSNSTSPLCCSNIFEVIRIGLTVIKVGIYFLQLEAQETYGYTTLGGIKL